MFVEIFIIVVFLIVISLLVVGLSLLVISTPPAPSNTASNTNTTTNPTKVYSWSENLRGNNNFDKFPPCFQTDSSCKSIYGSLLNLNQVQKYYNMIDILALLLCLEQKVSQCTTADIKDRLTQVLGMGANVSDKETIRLVKAFIPTIDKCESDKCKVIIGSIYILEIQMKIMANDTTISQEIKSLIKGHLYTFYTNRLLNIFKNCP